MINELAHLFRSKYPISIVVDVLAENWADVADWTGAKEVQDGEDRWLALPDDETARIGDVVLKTGDTFIVYDHDDWYGENGLGADFERVMFDAPEDDS